METITEFHPGLMKAEGQAALASLLALRPGVYRKVDLARAMSAATGITQHWAAGILSRLCAVGLAPHLRLRVGRHPFTLVDIDGSRIVAAFADWVVPTAPVLAIEPLEWVTGRPE